jgi:hypothetical protein
LAYVTDIYVEFIGYNILLSAYSDSILELGEIPALPQEIFTNPAAPQRKY